MLRNWEQVSLRDCLLKKLLVIQRNSTNNIRKAHLIQSNLAKMQRVKNQVQDSKKHIDTLRQQQQENHRQSVSQAHELRRKGREKVVEFKQSLQEKRKENYLQFKARESVINATIYENWKGDVAKKREKSRKKREWDEQSKMSRTIYFSKKREEARTTYAAQFQNEGERDVTALRRLEENLLDKLKESKMVLSRSLEKKERFLAG